MRRVPGARTLHVVAQAAAQAWRPPRRAALARAARTRRRSAASRAPAARPRSPVSHCWSGVAEEAQVRVDDGCAALRGSAGTMSRPVACTSNDASAPARVARPGPEAAPARRRACPSPPAKCAPSCVKRTRAPQVLDAVREAAHAHGAARAPPACPSSTGARARAGHASSSPARRRGRAARASSEQRAQVGRAAHARAPAARPRRAGQRARSTARSVPSPARCRSSTRQRPVADRATHGLAVAHGIVGQQELHVRAARPSAVSARGSRSGPGRAPARSPPGRPRPASAAGTRAGTGRGWSRACGHRSAAA